MYTTVNSTFTLEPPTEEAGDFARATKVNVYSFAAAAAAKKLTGNAKKHADAERAITDTIQYLGWMSLKDGDHSGTGKDVAQAIERRAAADRLIAAGTIVLIGTWSNGIAVGPGVGFSAATNEPAVIAPVKKSKRANPNSTKAQKAAYAASHQEEHDAHASEEGATCDWQSTWHGPAYVAKPRVRVPLATMQACSPRWVAPAPAAYPPGYILHDNRELDNAPAIWEAYQYMRSLHTSYAITDGTGNVIAPLGPVRTEMPATIVPAPIYAPAVGDTVAITYQHERMTTDRVVDVKRVARDGTAFGGYDRTYDRVRNYDMARVLTIRRLGGEGVEIAAG